MSGTTCTAQKIFPLRKFAIKDFFSKCNQICSFMRIWPHLLRKFLMENFIFCAVIVAKFSFFLFTIKKQYSIDLSYHIIYKIYLRYSCKPERFFGRNLFSNFLYVIIFLQNMFYHIYLFVFRRNVGKQPHQSVYVP